MKKVTKNVSYCSYMIGGTVKEVLQVISQNIESTVTACPGKK
jgi:hypothetical protein